MPSTNNNTNWKKKSGTLYEQELRLFKYDDPDNSIDKKKGNVIVRTDIKTGEVQYLEKTITGVGQGRRTTETLMRTVKSDGSETHNSPTLNAKYFGAGNPDGAQGQEERITKQTRFDVLSLTKQTLPDDEYQALRESEEYKSTANNPNTDPDRVTVSASGNFNVADVKGRAIPEGRKNEAYRYPLEVPDLGYDFIRITAYTYTVGGRQALTLKNRDSAKQRLIKESKKGETVILPMQPNFSESNAVSWGGDNINPAQLIGASAAGAGISFLGNLGQENNVEQLKNSLGDLGTEITNMIRDENTGPALVAYFAGQAVGANILGRTTGVTLNPNLELLFKGPNLRTFNFNFRFTPRSAKESQEIKEIIRVFKKNMAVQRSDSNLFLLTPRVFTVEYIYNAKGENAGGLHPYLNVFKPMAMTNLNVNYTPDGTYMTYNQGGSLTAYDLQMSFGELEPIYADEFNDSNDDDIGSFSEHKNMGY